MALKTQRLAIGSDWRSCRTVRIPQAVLAKSDSKKARVGYVPLSVNVENLALQHREAVELRVRSLSDKVLRSLGCKRRDERSLATRRF